MNADDYAAGMADPQRAYPLDVDRPPPPAPPPRPRNHLAWVWFVIVVVVLLLIVLLILDASKAESVARLNPSRRCARFVATLNERTGGAHIAD